MSRDKKGFRLATVLKVARIRERQAEAEAATKARAEAAARSEQELRSLIYEHRAKEEHEKTESYLHGRELARLQAAALAEASRRLEQAGVELDDARGRLIAQAIEVRTLERLEEQDHVRRAVSAAKAAERALDEVARMRRSPEVAP